MLIYTNYFEVKTIQYYLHWNFSYVTSIRIIIISISRLYSIHQCVIFMTSDILNEFILYIHICIGYTNSVFECVYLNVCVCVFVFRACPSVYWIQEEIPNRNCKLHYWHIQNTVNTLVKIYILSIPGLADFIKYIQNYYTKFTSYHL